MAVPRRSEAEFPKGRNGMEDINEWVVRMSARALHVAQELEAQCERSGLDSYMQAQIMLCAASDPEEVALWSEVWNYV